MIFLHLVTAKIWGGGEQYVYNFCQEELNRGNKSYVVVDESCEEIAQKYCKVATVIKAKIRGLSGMLAYSKIIGLLEDIGVNAICSHSGSASLLAVMLKNKFPKAKLLLFRHNISPNKKDFYHKWLQSKTDYFVCVSKAVYDLQLASCYEGYKHKYKLIYSGIDEKRFEVGKASRFSDAFTIGYAGRLIENKGVLILIEAFKKLLEDGHNIHLALAGPLDPIFKEVFEKTIADSTIKDHITWIGIADKIEDFYHSIDLFVLPSLVKESFGLVLCEAMSAGVPVITTDSGGQKEIINSWVDGVIIPARDIEALYQTILKIIDNETLRKSLVIAGKEKVHETFTIERYADELEGLLG